MLAEMIDAYLETRPADKERAKNCFHPSSLHRHPRELKRMYFSGDDAMRPAGRILRIFDNGHAVHERLQRYLKGIGVLIEGEAHLENKDFELE